MSGTASSAALELRGVVGGYGRMKVLRGVDLRVEPGQVVALLGPNGAGKTTLLRAAAGLLRVESGEISMAGDEVTRAQPHEHARRGLCLIPEGRGIFRNLTVAENLRLFTPKWVEEPRRDLVFESFPILKERIKQTAGTMSGGQQQMLALSRAILANPSLVLVDEVSMGLAPIAVDAIFEGLQALVERGAALLLVEQYIDRALEMADNVYLLKKGEIAFSGPPEDLRDGKLLAEYLGSVAELAQS